MIPCYLKLKLVNHVIHLAEENICLNLLTLIEAWMEFCCNSLIFHDLRLTTHTNFLG